MQFINENTFENYAKKRQESLFHEKFDAAVDSLQTQFGKLDLPIIINNIKVYTDNTYQHFSPTDRRLVFGNVSKASEQLIRKAITSSYLSFNEWRKVPYDSRIQILKKAVKTIRAKKFELAALLTFENGKNRYEAIADIDEAIDFINYYCHEIVKNSGYVTETKSNETHEKNTSVMKPYGVWGIISPFNFPAAIFVGMCIGVLITGNTAIVKPASNTPIIGYRIVEILIDCDLPPGVLNFVTGNASMIGKLLIRSNKISGIVFTGSKNIGFDIYKKSSNVTLRPIIAELGGKNPTIVTQYADLDKAAEGISRAAFTYAGQKCSACSRVYVQKSIKNQFLQKLISKVKKINIDNPYKRNSDLGPLINYRAFKNFKKYVNLASKNGTIFYGGRVLDVGDLRHGYYVTPTIITDLSPDNILLKKELFLPFLCIQEFDKFDEAITFCNNSEYGLTAGIYSNDKDEIEEFINRIESGVIYVNRQKSSTTGALVGNQSFSGWKNSGISGKGTGGKYYLTLFMREQSQTVIE